MDEILEHDRKHAAGQGPKHGIACDPLADGPADAVGGGVSDGGGRGSGAEELGAVELEPDDRDAIILITVMAVKESTMRTRAQGTWRAACTQPWQWGTVGVDEGSLRAMA